MKQDVIEFLNEHSVEEMLNVNPPPGVHIEIHIVLVLDEYLPFLLTDAPARRDAKMESVILLMSTDRLKNCVALYQYPGYTAIGIIKKCRDPWGRTFYVARASHCYKPYLAVEWMLQETIQILGKIDRPQTATRESPSTRVM